jgi:hypothetical protein
MYHTSTAEPCKQGKLYDEDRVLRRLSHIRFTCRQRNKRAYEGLKLLFFKMWLEEYNLYRAVQEGIKLIQTNFDFVSPY